MVGATIQYEQVKRLMMKISMVNKNNDDNDDDDDLVNFFAYWYIFEKARRFCDVFLI